MHTVDRWVVGFAALVVLTSLAVLASPLAASAETAQTAGGSGCAQCYTVKSGDTLSKIARKFGTTVDNLVALNGIANPDQIAAGTTICVKPKGSQPAGKYYTVKPGDTLYSIARKFGWTASYLAQVNTIPNPNEIYAGRVLWIPAH
jgi:LysM repeat protein